MDLPIFFLLRRRKNLFLIRAQKAQPKKFRPETKRVQTRLSSTGSDSDPPVRKPPKKAKKIVGGENPVKYGAQRKEKKKKVTAQDLWLTF